MTAGRKGAWLAIAIAMAAAGGPVLAQPVADAAASAPLSEISPSERALFMSNQLEGLHPPATLRYSVHKAGSLEAGFDDQLLLTLGPQSDSRCCSALVAFASTPPRMPPMQLDTVEGNPVIQYFLEHDLREMKRLTGGSPNYFRKLIRLSLAAGATLRPVSFRYRGRTVAGQEIDVSPYLEDPNRGRYPKLVGKRYVFLLSSAVPGGVYGIRTQVAGASADAAPLLVEEMMIEGAGATSASSSASASPAAPAPRTP